MSSVLLLLVFLCFVLSVSVAQTPSAYPTFAPTTATPTVSPTTAAPTLTRSPSRSPTAKPSAPTRSPTRKPTGKPSAAKFWYTTTDAEANTNIALAVVFGTFGAIVWLVTVYYKAKQEYVWSRKRLFIQERGRIAIGDFSIEAAGKFTDAPLGTEADTIADKYDQLREEKGLELTLNPSAAHTLKSPSTTGTEKVLAHASTL